MTAIVIRRGAVALLSTAAAAVLVIAGGAGGSAGAAENEPPTSGELHARSIALTTAPAAGWAGRGRLHQTAEEARSSAGGVAVRVPLPAGGTFNGIRFEDAEDLTDLDIQAVLEANAACQWWRAARDGRDAALATQVLAEIPRWPTFRDGERAELAAQVAEELAAGGGPAADGVLADCDAAHEREVEYANQRGWRASK